MPQNKKKLNRMYTLPKNSQPLLILFRSEQALRRPEIRHDSVIGHFGTGNQWIYMLILTAAC